MEKILHRETRYNAKTVLCITLIFVLIIAMTPTVAFASGGDKVTIDFGNLDINSTDYVYDKSSNQLTLSPSAAEFPGEYLLSGTESNLTISIPDNCTSDVTFNNATVENPNKTILVIDKYYSGTININKSNFISDSNCISEKSTGSTPPFTMNILDSKIKSVKNNFEGRSAITVCEAFVKIVNCQITGGNFEITAQSQSSPGGSGLVMRDGALTVQNSTITGGDNSAVIEDKYTKGGVGLAADNCNVLLQNSTIKGGNSGSATGPSGLSSAGVGLYLYKDSAQQNEYETVIDNCIISSGSEGESAVKKYEGNAIEVDGHNNAIKFKGDSKLIALAKAHFYRKISSADPLNNEITLTKNARVTFESGADADFETSYSAIKVSRESNTQGKFITDMSTSYNAKANSIDLNMKKNKTTSVTLYDPDLSMSEPPSYLQVGMTHTLSAIAAPKLIDDSVIWSSSNPSVATVSNKGVVTGKKAGTATITANFETAEKSISKTVKIVSSVSKVHSPVKTVYLKKGKSIKLPVKGYAGDTASPKLTWTSSKTKVATVSQKGTVKAKKTGTAKITVKAENGKSITITVKVVKKAKKITKLSIIGAPKTLKKGKSKYLTVKISPKAATSAVPKWTTSNKKVLTIDSAGKIVAKKKGTAKITVKIGKKKVTKTIKVK